MTVLAALHCQCFPCFDGKDSTALLRCGISIWPMSQMGPTSVIQRFRKVPQRHYASRLAISEIYFSYSTREIRLPSRSTQARSFVGKEAWRSSTRFHGARGVSHVERGTNSDD